MSMQSLMIKKEKFNFELSYVAFLDVLGFRALVLSQKEEDQDRVAVYFGAIKVFPQLLGKLEENIKIASISDSLVLCMNCNGDTLGDRFRSFCKAVAKLQASLAEQDIWVRGGISVGDVHIEDNKNLVVGEGLVRAYELESKRAKFPRIILDTALVKKTGCKTNRDFISLCNKGSKGEPAIIYDWLYRPDGGVRFEQDVPFFLDYLSSTIYKSNLRDKILHNVETNLSRVSIEHYPKYDWVRRYLMSLYEGSQRYEGNVQHEELEKSFLRLAEI